MRLGCQGKPAIDRCGPLLHFGVMLNKPQGHRAHAGKGRLRLNRDAGTGVYTETRKVVVTSLVRRPADAAGKRAQGVMPGRRPGQEVYFTADMPEDERRALERQLADLGG